MNTQRLCDILLHDENEKSSEIIFLANDLLIYFNICLFTDV